MMGALGLAVMFVGPRRYRCGNQPPTVVQLVILPLGQPDLRFTIRQSDMKDRAAGMIVRHPDVSTMGLNDGLANGKSYSRPGGFRRKERLKDTALVPRIYSRPGIFDDDHDTGTLLNEIRSDPQQTDAIGDGAHRFDGVHEQVHKDLLQLGLICGEFGKALAQLG
jgi:hypothetical protein